MKYEFVEREEIERELLTLPPTMTGRAIRKIVGRLMSEREAYRELCGIMFVGMSTRETKMKMIDEEALAILSQQDKGEEAK